MRAGTLLGGGGVGGKGDGRGDGLVCAAFDLEQELAVPPHHDGWRLCPKTVRSDPGEGVLPAACALNALWGGDRCGVGRTGKFGGGVRVGGVRIGGVRIGGGRIGGGRTGEAR